MTHTPTPWRFEKHGRNSDYFGNIVGIYGVTDHGSEKIRTITCQLKYGPEEENQANAEFIVTAVNAYDDMLALARDYRGAVEFYMRADLKRGDTEGANMKRLTMDYIDSQIAKATAP